MTALDEAYEKWYSGDLQRLLDKEGRGEPGFYYEECWAAAWDASRLEADAEIATLTKMLRQMQDLAISRAEELAEALRALTQISTMIAEMDDSAEYYFWHQFEDIDKVARTGLAGQPSAPLENSGTAGLQAYREYMNRAAPAWEPKHYRHGDLVNLNGELWQYVAEYEKSVDDSKPGESTHWLRWPADMKPGQPSVCPECGERQDLDGAWHKPSCSDVT